VDAAIDRFGRIDILVNNAGRTQVGAVEETTDQELRDLFELHFFAPAALTRAVLPQMRSQGSGTIVQMSSVGGQTTAPGFGAYCATKFGLEGLTETLQEEVAPFGIRTIIVEPGAFRTGLFRKDAAYFSADMPEYEETVGRPVPTFVASTSSSRAIRFSRRGRSSRRLILTTRHYGSSSAPTRSGTSAVASSDWRASSTAGRSWARRPPSRRSKRLPE
jgi:NAD(P)-dependent dehydrogenase (short-subunit alcohol dehydrogenase family)